MYKKSQAGFLSFIWIATLLLAYGCASQPAAKPAAPAQGELPKPAPKGPTEKTYSEEFDRVWDNVVEVVTEKGLSEHPHGKMSASKDAGKITTPVFRYFKISSAKPVQEKDYRDSYTITVASEAKTKEAAAKAKADEAEAKLAEAKGKTEEANGKSGDEAKTLLEEAKQAESEAKKLGEESAKSAEEAKAAAAKPKAVTVKIQRKFEMYDNVKKAWVETEPTIEKVGFTEEALLNAVDAKMAAAPPAGAKPAAGAGPNLNLTPPIFTEEGPKPNPVSEAPKK